LLGFDAMENALDTTRRPAGRDGNPGDFFDALLRWMHRILNPPAPVPARVESRDRRRHRDRVPV
jgi:hypothetical protein